MKTVDEWIKESEAREWPLDFLIAEIQREAILAEPILEHFAMGPEGMTAAIRSKHVVSIVSILAGWFVDNNGKNYIEAEMMSDELGPLILTLQRKWGKSPHQLRNEAQALCASLLRELIIDNILSARPTPEVVFRAQEFLAAAGYGMDAAGVMGLSDKTQAPEPEPDSDDNNQPF